MTLINFGIWEILTVISVICLIIFWRGKNAVWGGLTLGVFIGLVIALIYLFKGDGFIWKIVGKGLVIGTLAGTVSELMGSIGDRLKNKQRL